MKIEMFGCWLPPAFASEKGYSGEILYVVSAFDDCKLPHSVEYLIITFADFTLGNLPEGTLGRMWDALQNDIYNKFVEIHRMKYPATLDRFEKRLF